MTTTPDTDRQARRTTVTVLLARVSARKVLTGVEAEELRNHITAEQADGDQAREQLAGQLAIAETNRAEAEALRVTLADALGHPTGRTWAELIGAARILRTDVLGSTRHRAETAEQAARDARQGETEAIRARKAAEEAAAEARATEFERAVRDDARHAELSDALGFQAQRGMLAWPALVKAVRTLQTLKDDHRTRADQQAELLEIAEQAGNRAETLRAEVVADNERLRARASRAEQRAERAEATLTAVREAAYKLADGTFAGARASCLVLDALGAPQPATADVDPVCGCGAAECEICTPMRHLTAPEQPAALDGAALWAAIRDHAARDHQFWDQLNRHYGQLYRRGVRP